MKRLLERAGVDYTQWHALTRAFAKLDFSQLIRTLKGAEGLGAAAKSILGLAFLALTMGLFGALPAYVLLANDDLWMGGAFLSMQIACLLSFILLVNHAAMLVSPDDHAILGFRPVSSRTYFAVRVTALFVHTMPLVTFVAVVPLLALAIRPHTSLAIVLGGVAVIYVTAIVTTLGLLSIYGWLLVVIGARRFGSVVSYVQIAATIVVFGGMTLLADPDLREWVTTTAVPRTAWALVAPPVWFGSYLELAGGSRTALLLTAALWSLATIALVLRAMGGKLSLNYAGRLAQLAATTAPGEARSVRVPRFFRDETRATAILVRSQFRNDLKFRMGVLAILPITIVYGVIGWRSGDLPRDPFLGDSSGAAGVGLIQVALFFLPDTLRQSLVISDAYRASWLFHTTPADRTRLVMSSQFVIAALFLTPYLVLIGCMLAVLFGHPGHALVHDAFLGWLSYLALLVQICLDPKLPFSMPPAAAAPGAQFGVRLVVSIAGMLAYMFLTLVMYRSIWRMIAAVVALTLLTLLLNLVLRRRVEARAAELQYTG